jgi:hypothetical protein
MLKRIKKRRNPSEEEDLRERRLEGYYSILHTLHDVIENGNPDNLVNSIILYNQGLICYDCYNEELGEKPKEYHECICEKCSECRFRRNLCYLDIEYKGPSLTYYTEEERERVKEAGYELILEILADDLYNDGRKYNIIPDFKYKNLNELKKEFLKRSLRKDNIDLSHAKLSYLDLSNINLSNADLSRASLTGANLSGTNLTGANLFKADLARANLSEANLSGADLTEADLYQSNFYNAEITKTTNFTNTHYLYTAVNLKRPNPKKIIKNKNIGFSK